MRRTYISIALLANGFDVKWVMSQVGHADSKMTLDVYAQLEKRVERAHGTAFDALIRRASERPKLPSNSSNRPLIGPRLGHESKNRRFIAHPAKEQKRRRKRRFAGHSRRSRLS